MTFRFRSALFLLIACAVFPQITHAASLAESLAGRILLQVESRGEAWYVDPVSKHRFYLGHAEDAYALMRAKGLGIRHAELQRYRTSRFPSRLSGRILLDVESHGEAYYIIPGRLTSVYLGRAEDAYQLMRRYGLGITNGNLARIPVGTGTISLPTPVPTPISSASPYQTIEQSAFDLINAYRLSKGRSPLIWNTEVANAARAHSLEMANGTVPFGHARFTERADALQAQVRFHGIAENVAYNDYPDPAQTSVDGWIESEGHRTNIENQVYTESGMGVARSSDGAYYFTQLFIAP